MIPNASPLLNPSSSRALTHRPLRAVGVMAGQPFPALRLSSLEAQTWLTELFPSSSVLVGGVPSPHFTAQGKSAPVSTPLALPAPQLQESTDTGRFGFGSIVALMVSGKAPAGQYWTCGEPSSCERPACPEKPVGRGNSSGQVPSQTDLGTRPAAALSLRLAQALCACPRHALGRQLAPALS